MHLSPQSINDSAELMINSMTNGHAHGKCKSTPMGVLMTSFDNGI